MKVNREQIQKLLLHKMKQQDIHTIKVTDLTGELHISRSTFYLYYDSVFTVLQDIEDSFFDQLWTIAKSFWTYPPGNQYLSQPHPIIFEVMAFLQKNCELCQILWGPYGDQTFRIRCHRAIQQAFFPKHLFGDQSSFETRCTTVFLSGGHLELINYWIASGCQVSPAEFTLIVYKLMFRDIP